MGEQERRGPRIAPKAYENLKFLKSHDARVIRILSEYLEPLQRFQRMNVRETVVFFGSARARPPEQLRAEQEAAQAEKRRCGGRIPPDLRLRLDRLEKAAQLSRYYADAVELSAMLTRWAKTLRDGNRFVVCSGGGPGIMEAANLGATKQAGGLSIGLKISLPNEQYPNSFISAPLVFDFHYFFMRKLWFVYLACGLVVFPGGFGTMDELFEILTLVQTRKIDRPIPIVLYGSKFWRDFVDWDALIRWGTINPKDLELFHVCDDPKDAFEFLKREMIRCYPRALRWGRPGRQR